MTTMIAHRSINQHCKSDQLKQARRKHQEFPSNEHTNDPNQERTAAIDHTSCCCTEMPSNAQSEAVKQRNGKCYGYTCPKYGGSGDDLIPAFTEIEVARQVAK